MYTCYLVIGNGKLAKHLCYYLSLLKLPHRHWYRQKSNTLFDELKLATHVLLAITDMAIDPFIIEQIQPHHLNLMLVHFSGCTLSSRANTAHPLQTFSNELYDDAMYQIIPFFIEKEGPKFEDLLPGFKNPHYVLPRVKKAYYHALCVMANNFTTLLWQKLVKEMQEQFLVNEKDIQPFLQQTFLNLNHNMASALTGPIMRGDHKTIQENLKALSHDDFYAVYKAFCQVKGIKI